MRILVLGDSHCRDMDGVFKELNSGTIVKTVFVSRQTSLVRLGYLRRIEELKSFSPERILIHVGHNDLNYHWRYNTDPSRLEDYFPQFVSFVELVKSSHPGSIIYLSNIFPRPFFLYIFYSSINGNTRKIQYYIDLHEGRIPLFIIFNSVG